MAQNFQTPGVYVQELNAFPNSVVSVATAIPAFIGYTQISSTIPGTAASSGPPVVVATPTQYFPTEINSLLEFEQLFGAGYNQTFTLTAIGATAAAMTTPPTPPTLPTNYGTASYAYPSLPPAPVLNLSIGSYLLTSGGAKTINPNIFQLYNAVQLFYLNGGGTCYIVSLGTYPLPTTTGTGSSTVTTPVLLPPASATYSAAIASLELQPDPTMLLCPDALMYDIDDYNTIMQLMLAHCNKVQSRVAIFDVYGGAGANMLPGEDPSTGSGPSNLPAPVAAFRNGVGQNYLNYGISYFPWVNAGVYSMSDISFLNIDPATLAMLQGALDPIAPATATTPAVTGVLVPQWDAAPSTSGPPTVATVEIFNEAADLQGFYNSPITIVLANLSAPGFTVTSAPQAMTLLEAAIQTVNNGLIASFPDYSMLMTAIANYLNAMPVAPAMAGIITAVDGNVGPWQAPANYSLTAVVSPTVSLNDLLQKDMNVDAATGKSVNAIRAFRGLGTIVWGARTLDGNSQDWRYISVRRTAILIEQSIKLALRSYVFQANDANTWTNVTSMINNYLYNLWKQGALQGTAPAQAFVVQVGLGTTMTSDDILDGIMRVTVLAAIVRPAEFIQLTFQQLMPTS